MSEHNSKSHHEVRVRRWKGVGFLCWYGSLIIIGLYFEHWLPPVALWFAIIGYDMVVRAALHAR